MMQSVFDSEMDSDAITGLITLSHFDSIQDFRFAIDLLPQIRGLFMERKGGGISVYGANEPNTYIAMAKQWLMDDDIEVSPSEKLSIYYYKIIKGE